jgi:hypothetical protein
MSDDNVSNDGEMGLSDWIARVNELREGDELLARDTSVDQS